MTGRNLELVQGTYDAWSRGDFRAPADVFDPDVEFVMNPEFPDAGRYSGVDELAAYTRHFLEPWSRITIEAEELAEAGDHVLAAIRQHGVGNESGIATELRYFQLWTLRGGKVVRLENIRERVAAFAAAGLPE